MRSSPKLLSALASMVILVGVAGRPLGGYLIKRTGMHLLIAVGLILSAIGCFILAKDQISIEWIMLAILLLGTGCALPYAGLFHGATLLFTGRAGAAKGLVNMLGVLVILMGAPLFGYIKDETGGFHIGFMVMGAFSLLVLFASFKIKKIDI